MTQWYEVRSPPRTKDALASTTGDGRVWHVLVVDGRVAACSSFPHCPVSIGEEWAPRVAPWLKCAWTVSELFV
jgi:hypothetical protein